MEHDKSDDHEKDGGAASQIMMNETTITLNTTVKPELAELPCFSCGELVAVMLPFYGCVYCTDCGQAKSYFTIPDATE